MQHGNVPIGAEPTQDADFFFGGYRLQDLQSLVRVSRQDHMVKLLVPPVGRQADAPSVGGRQAGDLGLDMYSVSGEMLQYGIDILLRPSGNRHPVWTSGNGA